jgi:hypothetical protein
VERYSATVIDLYLEAAFSFIRNLSKSTLPMLVNSEVRYLPTYLEQIHYVKFRSFSRNKPRLFPPSTFSVKGTTKLFDPTWH